LLFAHCELGRISVAAAAAATGELGRGEVLARYAAAKSAVAAESRRWLRCGRDSEKTVNKKINQLNIYLIQ